MTECTHTQNKDFTFECLKITLHYFWKWVFWIRLWLFYSCMILEYIVSLNHAYIPNNIFNYTVSKIIFVNITTNVIRIVFNYSEAIKLIVVGMCFLQFWFFNWKFKFYHWPQVCPLFPLMWRLHCVHFWKKKCFPNTQLWINIVSGQSWNSMIKVFGSAHRSNNGPNVFPQEG